MNRAAACAAAVFALLLAAVPASAGFTETLPKGVVLIDLAYAQSNLNSGWDDHGKRGPLIEEIDRYEPGGGKQGTLIPKPHARFDVLIAQLQVGILDGLTGGIGVPIVLGTRVEPNLDWESGDYQWIMGRAYSEDDFWQWAESMGQPKPGTWEGNKGVLADIVVGLRYRYSDLVPWFRKADLALAVAAFGAIPTGRQADPEEVLAAGTTSWDLHAQGDLGIHLSADKSFRRELDDRLVLGVDVFYEALLPHRYRTADGTKNPLLLTYSPYVGKRYTLDPGDFLGASAQADVVAYRGPALCTWLVKKDREKAAKLPPILTFSFRYTFNYLFQSDWKSKSAIWDWDREKLWRPGYKNILTGKVSINLLRLGVPMIPYASYRNLTWIPGKNSRAVDLFMFGLQVPLKFGTGM
jgi:hypothetical protein